MLLIYLPKSSTGPPNGLVNIPSHGSCGYIYLSYHPPLWILPGVFWRLVTDSVKDGQLLEMIVQRFLVISSYLENKLLFNLFISINFTPKNSHSCLKKIVLSYVFQVSEIPNYTLGCPPAQDSRKIPPG